MFSDMSYDPDMASLMMLGTALANNRQGAGGGIEALHATTQGPGCGI